MRAATSVSEPCELLLDILDLFEELVDLLIGQPAFLKLIRYLMGLPESLIDLILCRFSGPVLDQCIRIMREA